MKLTAEQINLSLNLPHQKQNDVLIDLEREFLNNFQSLLELFYDATAVIKSNLDESAKKLLFARIINNLIFSYSALMRGHQIECYTLLRVDLEILDLIHFFHQQPTLSLLWFMGGREAKETFSHSSVKKVVGAKPHDFLYPEISRMGTHPTYYSTLFMAPKSERKINEGIPSVTIFIGGNHKESDSYICGTLYLLVCLLVFIEMCEVFKNQIKPFEYMGKMTNYTRDSINFIGKHLDLLSTNSRVKFEKYRKRLEEIINFASNSMGAEEK